jgi:hypothetical protein
MVHETTERWYPVRVMRGFSLAAMAALAALGVAGCTTDCLQSADIQVMVVPDSSISPALVTKLNINIVVGDGSETALSSISLTSGQLTASGSAFLLRPKATPTGPYMLHVVVLALDKNQKDVAIGSSTTTVAAKGCNRMTVQLTALGALGQTPDLSVVGGGGGTGGGGGDLAGADLLMSLPTDMANCTGGTPDEDVDLRADACDVCAADPEPQGPSDSDADGVPDACDPDPNTFGNRTVMFEPFNNNGGQWALGNGISINNGYLDMATNQQDQLLAGDSIDLLPVNVRVQTWYMNIGGNNGFNSSQTIGLLLGNNSDLNNPKNTSGVMCSVNTGGGKQPTLQLAPVVNTAIGTAASTQFHSLQTGSNKYRIRLTQRGANYTCELAELVDQNTNAVSVLATTTMTADTAPDGAQFVSMLSENLQEVHFYSVVAQTANP